MRRILSISYKDFLIRFGQPTEILFFLILPIIFTVTLGGGFGGDQEARVEPLPIVNEDNSVAAQVLIDTLAENQAINPTAFSRDEALTQLDDEAVAGVLIIPSGFGEQMAAGNSAEIELLSQPGNEAAFVIQRVVRSAVAQTEQMAVTATVITANSDNDFDSSLLAAQSDLANQPDRAVVVGTTSAEPVLSTSAHASAGQLVTWVLIPLLGVSGMLAAEKENGALRRLLTTPTRKPTFMLGKIVGQLGPAMVQMALLVLFGMVVMKVNWGQSVLGFIVMMISFGLAAVSMGTMLGTLTKSFDQANGLSIMLGMVMALLGGCWWPIELFPDAVRNAVQVLPTTWAMRGFTDLVQRGLGVEQVLPEAGVLLGFAAVFFVIGSARYRYE